MSDGRAPNDGEGDGPGGERAASGPGRDGPARVPGEVWLVGAGPGDPGLQTIRGRELLGRADVVVTDRLVSAEVLAFVRPDAEIIYSGKSAGALTRTQEDLNALLVDRALAGHLVVRLKGGDPFVLGRGGEEAEACRLAGVACTVVPGVTSAFAGPAYAGIPVTHRGVAQDVAVVSGHLPPGHPDSGVDWAALGASRMTLVVLMGVARLADIAAALIDGGRLPDTPVAVIERATTPAQRVVRGTLDMIAVDAIALGVRSPAVVVIGAVAARCDAPARITPPPGGDECPPSGAGPSGAGYPLAGVRVLVPRTRSRPGLLAARLRALGADAVETVVSRPGPVADVEAEPDPRIAEELYHGDLHAVAFASSTAARATAALYGPLPPGILVVAMGVRTVTACQRAGLRVDAVATEPGIYPLAAAVVTAVTEARSR
ncbi:MULTISPECIES: uroporphyrinogen-III C-methyltransferase [unclassified Frankia]|uniref:uroporphyrinogen-III C-methyltransferase n=1 Tax=unclassified Frankia TaxID=2632575 RepID=UPI002AD2287A|nr:MULTISPECIES: uroporphyrinogen-III C-methyltransferase [unclassified Frankia]